MNGIEETYLDIIAQMNTRRDIKRNGIARDNHAGFGQQAC